MAHHRRRFLTLSILLLVVLPLSGLSNPVAAATAQPVSTRICANAARGFAHCNAFRRTDVAPLAAGPNVTPSGYSPSNLQSAYKLPSRKAGSGQTVAIVDAFDDPNAEADLSVYRTQFSLGACTTSNGCFRKVNQTGGTSYPPPDVGWAEEISLDLDMVSAICPNCHILLVEANDSSINNLGAAVDEAAVLGANAISNSYGGSEYSDEVSEEVHYNHPGIAITASSGDNGYDVEFPAASQYVTAVGGTKLTSASNARRWTETVWRGAGSGCSAFISKPSWQHDTQCSNRTVADVAAVADPATDVAVYDTYVVGGWVGFGGTSVSAPIIASVYALASNEASTTYGSYPYNHTSRLFDVMNGSNGGCANSYLCTGEAGYDGPSGNGTPNGTGGF